MNSLLSNLNPQQQQAVTAGLGPILVMAGPGSGKTRVLTQRVAYLITAMGVRPHQILAVTFTNKAAKEMENRVAHLVGDYTRGLTLGTFHSICARLLRREAEHLPFASNFVIFDADDQVNLVKRAILDLNLDEKHHRAPGIHASISNAKNELFLPDTFPVKNYRDEVAQRVYQRYQQLLLANNALDFDDLLLYTAMLLRENASVREKYARRYEHILVDEFQDTNLAQYELLKHLASVHQNILVVGDTDQSIYRWRGADYRNVLRFEEDYPAAQVILLEQNYRSTQTILDAAMAVIDRNPYRTHKQLFTERGQGEKVILYEAYDDRSEASYITDAIIGMQARKQARPGDCAIMYRTNAQSRVIEEAFLHAGLPYKLVGAQRFYGRREIKDIIAYLRLVHNPSDELSLGRIINTPTRSIGDKTFLALRTLAQNANLSPGALLLDLARNPDSLHRAAMQGRAGTALVKFGSLLANWIGQKSSLPPLSLMDRILEETDYHAYIDDGTDEGHDRWENVMELRRLASEFQELGLEAFLEQIALVSDQDTLGVQNDESGQPTEVSQKATLLTLHAAKGLEFPIVFITGLNDGTLPHSRSFDDPEEMMEERRLLYVGITRAEDRLFLMYAQNRSSYGYAEPVEPSRFLRDIPSELLDETQPGRTQKRYSSQQSTAEKVSYKPERWGLSGPAAPLQEPAASRSTPTYPKPLAPRVRTEKQNEKRSEAHPEVRRQAGGLGAGSGKPVEQRYHPGMKVSHAHFGSGMVLNSSIQNDDEIVEVFFEGVGMKRLAASLARLEIKS